MRVTDISIKVLGESVHYRLVRALLKIKKECASHAWLNLPNIQNSLTTEPEKSKGYRPMCYMIHSPDMVQSISFSPRTSNTDSRKKDRFCLSESPFYRVCSQQQPNFLYFLFFFLQDGLDFIKKRQKPQ